MICSEEFTVFSSQFTVSESEAEVEAGDVRYSEVLTLY